MASNLTTCKVQTVTKPGRYGDGGGLYLQVSKWGTKAWLFRFMLAGQSRQMGLGSIVQNAILSTEAFYTLMFTAFWLNVSVPITISLWKPYCESSSDEKEEP